ncbi:MAG TPA: aminoglycoside phosphotransferase family protein [Vicinamibacterales bacterium]|nr:aminoglycoside phosphotransferase family protein [Vicinamibacterales bacterium]
MTVETAAAAIVPDAALPCRDVLFDSAAMTNLFEGFGRSALVHVDAVSPVRVNYQVGKSVRVVYRVVLDGGTHTVAVRMFRRGKSAEQYGRARPAAVDVGRLRGLLHAPAIESVLWLFPNDRKLDTLRAVLDPALVVPGASGPVARKQLAAYAPEKSATLACEGADGRALAYAKVAASYQAARDYDTYTALGAALPTNDAWLRLPAPHAYDPDRRTLWLEAIDGRRLADGAWHDGADDLRQLGAAVARFHRLPSDRASVFERFSPAQLTRDADIIRTARPDVAHDVETLVGALIATPPAECETACLHGDLHPKNAIACGGRLALIDVEDVAAGPPAADIGSLIASLLYLREGQRLTVDNCARGVRAFLAGYESVGAVPAPASLAWHTAAALFIERASRSVTRIRPLGLMHLPRLVGAAHRLLDRGLDL